jgi:hypothetical protein
MMQRRSRFRVGVGAPTLLASLATLFAGCSLLLDITDITPAPDAGDDVAAAGESTPPPGDSSVAGRDASKEGGGDASGDASPCREDLSFIDTGGFSIAFTLKTAQPDRLIALVNQRHICSRGVFWDIRLFDGLVYTELSDFNLGDTFFSSTGAPLNDGNTHEVVVTRASGGLVQVTVDGVPSGSTMAKQSFGFLDPLRVGTDACLGTNGTVVLQGSLTNLCARPQ